MDGIKDPEQVPLESVEAINNLDTARMALRWAMERISSLQKAAGELEARLAEAREARLAAEAKQQGLERHVVLREAEQRQRERYYARLEEFASPGRFGKADVAALVKKEMETAALQESLEQKQIQLEKEFEAKRGALEARQRQSLSSARELEERAARALAGEAEARKSLADQEQDIQSRLAAMRAERLKELSDLKSARQAWEREKSLLLDELGAWRRGAQESQERAQ